MGATSGRKSLLPEHLETKLIDLADNRAKLGIGFGKERFLDYAGKLAHKQIQKDETIQQMVAEYKPPLCE